jgi:hypothetical protein
MEVMGLMLGSFVDDYTITCVDVFAMPQVRLIMNLSYHFPCHYNSLFIFCSTARACLWRP